MASSRGIGNRFWGERAAKDGCQFCALLLNVSRSQLYRYTARKKVAITFLCVWYQDVLLGLPSGLKLMVAELWAREVGRIKNIATYVFTLGMNLSESIHFFFYVDTI